MTTTAVEPFQVFQFYIYKRGFAAAGWRPPPAASRMAVVAKRGIKIGEPKPHKSNGASKGCTVKYVDSK